MSLSPCLSCRGLVPSSESRCPHCGREVPKRSVLAKGLAVLGASAASITLMACYGAPPLQVCEFTGADGGPQAGGRLCQDTCVSAEEAARRGYECYESPKDGGADGGIDGGP